MTENELSSTDCSSEHASVIYRFKNIGPAKNAEIEIGDLTIISGRNNTGKTYLSYTLYGILKLWRARLSSRRLSARIKRRLNGIQDLSRVLEDLLKNGRSKLTMDDDLLAEQRSAVLRFLSQQFSRNALSQVFNSPDDEFDNSSIEVIYNRGKVSGISCSPIEFEIEEGSKLLIAHENNTIDISINRKFSPFSQFQVKSRIVEFYSIFLLHDLFSQPFILSAERFGISLFYRELDFTKNQLVDMLQKIGKTKSSEILSPFYLIDRATSRYALPIKDNIDYTRSIPELRKLKSVFAENKLSDHIKNMMLGYYSSSGDEIRFISKARGKGRSFNIPLHLASSSARGLSDLYFFVRHVAEHNALLIIDEPESHLDTKNQIEFARLLSRFVRVGLKVLLTTHSDYLIKEVNNLIMLGQNFSGREDLARKFKYDLDDALHVRSVRGYIAENGTLKKCEVDRFGIDMPVFDITIDEINTVANELASSIEIESCE